jgi:hypothetical protein
MGASGQMTLDGLLPLVLLLVLRPRIQRRKSLLQSGRYGKSGNYRGVGVRRLPR